jgi:capsule polysaccharide export protein KpsE/RkpR
MKNSISNEGLIDIELLSAEIWRRKIFLVTLTSIITLIFIFFALSLPNIYISQSKLMPSSTEDSLSSKIGGLSSLASIGGLTMPTMSAGKSQEGIERIKSFEFFSTQFLPNIDLENIVAVKKWIPEKNIIVYDKKLFDKAQEKWVRKVKYPKNAIPSDQEAYKIYSKILKINEDKVTSFITISIEHESPIIAKEWVDIIIYKINESMRQLDADLAKKSMSYLNEESKLTKVQSIKDVISNLLESQMQTLMLTASNEAYVFKVIDSSIVPEEKSKPNRILIVILGFLLGSMLSLLFISVKYYFSFRKSYEE